MSLVVITDSTFPDTELERSAITAAGGSFQAAQAKDRDSLIALTKDADVVITQFSRVDAEVIKAMTRAKVIARYGIGVDNVDLEAAKAKGIPVCNVPDYCIDEVADHTLAMVLDLTRRTTETSTVIHRGEWRLPVKLEELRALRDCKVGVVGFGRIGREVAARLRAFKATVLVFDPVVDANEIARTGCVAASLEQLLQESDLITLHCPSTDKTRKLLNASTLATCKRGVLVVNLGRGDLVDSQSLVAALQSGQVGAAGLDVFDPEPVPAGHPLLAMPNVIITPHVASGSVRAVRALREGVIAHAIRALKGEAPRNVVNDVAAVAKAK